MPHTRTPQPADPALASDLGVDVALRASMLDALGEAVIATDLAGRIIYWNDAATRLYGWGADEVIGSLAVDLIPAQGTRSDAEAIMDRLRGGEPWSGEFLVRGRHGRIFPALMTSVPVRDRDGRAIGIVGVSRDISVQREAEATARDAQTRLELVRRAATSVLWEWEPGAGATHWSPAVAEAFGYPPDEIERGLQWWASKVHPEDRARVRESFDRFVADGGRFWTEEYRFLRADDGYATVFDRAYMAHDDDGRPVRVVGTMIDLTERRRLHEEQRFLAQASMLLDLSLDYEATLPTIARLAAISVCDYCIIAVPDADGFTGLVAGAHTDPRLQPMVDELGRYLAAGPAEDSLLDRAMRSGEATLLRRLPYGFVADAVPRGRLRELARELAPASLMFVPLRARRLRVGYMALASTRPDHIFDDHDLALAEELGRRAGLAVDHARALQSAELAHQAKSDFLAVISHELRTPLTAVLGYAELIADQISGPLNETQQAQVARIRAGADRLLGLIEGILGYARLETGGERVQKEEVAPADLVRRVEDLIRPRAAEQGVNVRIHLEALPDTIQADAGKVTQVLLSLLGNAVKFTGPGLVELTGSATHDTLRFDVSDSGRGIAPEHLPHVFNPFWQAEQPATRRAGGAGLGLSLARRLARLMGGDVIITKSSPQGTTFRFEVPHA